MAKTPPPPKSSGKDTLPLPDGQDVPLKKPSRLKRIVIILAILLMTLAAAGGGAYWWFVLRTPPPHDAAAEAAHPAEAEQAKPGTAAGPAPTAPAAQSKGSGGTITPPEGLPRSAGIVLPLPSVTVNLTDPGGRRYLRLGMEVEVNADVSAQIKAQSPRIRDAVIMLLAGKSYADIASLDGKVLLKAEVANRLNQILGAQRVIRVFFTEFVVE
ncbi:MAG: flagellar basal body-associated FliL family protein [Desulfovibrio sp.]|jgi:flagellar FliL protein|nr:flagellar basal body-associated FliL family protein [Desulfovibrio sp.]